MTVHDAIRADMARDLRWYRAKQGWRTRRINHRKRMLRDPLLNRVVQSAAKRKGDMRRPLRSLQRRDGWSCCHCGGLMYLHGSAGVDPKLWRTIEHVVPLALGGSNRLENLKLAHYGCNQAGNRLLTRARNKAVKVLRRLTKLGHVPA